MLCSLWFLTDNGTSLGLDLLLTTVASVVLLASILLCVKASRKINSSGKEKSTIRATEPAPPEKVRSSILLSRQPLSLKVSRESNRTIQNLRRQSSQSGASTRSSYSAGQRPSLPKYSAGNIANDTPVVEYDDALNQRHCAPDYAHVKGLAMSLESTGSGSEQSHLLLTTGQSLGCSTDSSSLSPTVETDFVEAAASPRDAYESVEGRSGRASVSSSPYAEIRGGVVQTSIPQTESATQYACVASVSGAERPQVRPSNLELGARYLSVLRTSSPSLDSQVPSTNSHSPTEACEKPDKPASASASLHSQVSDRSPYSRIKELAGVRKGSSPAHFPAPSQQPSAVVHLDLDVSSACPNYQEFSLPIRSCSVSVNPDYDVPRQLHAAIEHQSCPLSPTRKLSQSFSVPTGSERTNQPLSANITISSPSNSTVNFEDARLQAALVCRSLSSGLGTSDGSKRLMCQSRSPLAMPPNPPTKNGGDEICGQTPQGTSPLYSQPSKPRESGRSEEVMDVPYARPNKLRKKAARKETGNSEDTTRNLELDLMRSNGSDLDTGFSQSGSDHTVLSSLSKPYENQDSLGPLSPSLTIPSQCSDSDSEDLNLGRPMPCAGTDRFGP